MSGLTKSATPPFKIPQWAEEFVGPKLEVLEDKTLCFPNQNRRKGQNFKIIQSIMYFVKNFKCARNSNYLFARIGPLISM